MFTETRYGLGLPPTFRPSESIDIYSKLNLACRPVHQMGVSFFKISLLLSYVRFLRGTDYRAFRITSWSAIGLIFISHLICSLILIFACSPVGSLPKSKQCKRLIDHR